DPVGKPLYNDGRIITGIVPETDFLGTPLYQINPPDENEINQRKKDYFDPYHNRLSELISDLNSTFGSVLLWDAHSIKRFVPTIQNQPFPDMILGSADECSAEKPLIDQVLQNLSDSPFKIAHNFPFKGGYITRSKGNPKVGINALQLEMSKNLYMDESETKLDNVLAGKVSYTLSKTFESIAKYLG
ncbi:MAG: N-formylglutamate amidohydrolase, partial [Cyclobacteriaceae bacterium]|nr:N-formylglutamate amidohydrolase [Cyclobacteriaceae bacterium]